MESKAVKDLMTLYNVKEEDLITPKGFSGEKEFIDCVEKD